MELTALYTFVDDFFKEIQKTTHWKSLYHLWQGSRGQKKKMSLSEIVTLNILKFKLRVADLKLFYRLASEKYSEAFPNLPNYENFLKATNRSSVFTLLLLRYPLYVNKITSSGNNHFIDSTSLPICQNYNIYSHKVNKNIAQRGKSTKGWFYGFKLHGVCNEKGELENVLFTPGNIHDNKTLERLVSDLAGVVTADAGYLIKEDVFQRIFEKEIYLYIATRKNMKQIMSKGQHQLFKMQSKIETLWGILKEKFLIVSHLARSPHGLFRHYFYSIIAFILVNKEKSSFLWSKTRISAYLDTQRMGGLYDTNPT